MLTNGEGTMKIKKIIWKILRISLYSILGGFVLFIGIQLYIITYASSYIKTVEEVPQADAVLVLGASVYGNHTPSPILRDRLEYGYQVYKANKAGKIIVSGDHGTDYYDEVIVMKKYLLNKGVPEEDIVEDHAGFDTYDSVYRAKAIFCVDSIIISTQEYHIYRAIYVARQLGIEAYGVASPNKKIYNMPYNHVRESLARIKTIYDVNISKRLPKYLGDQIPIERK